jgi:transcriptional regulator with XRE-family HTH domain
MDDRTDLGGRIRQLRSQVSMSQRKLAERASVSVDLIRKLEQGLRQTASIGSLQSIARALDIDIAELLNKATPLPDSAPDSGVVAIRRVLTSIDDLLGPVGTDGEVVSVAEIQREATYAWGSYWSGKYGQLGTLLPQALTRARVAETSAHAEQRETAADLLAQLYQITGCTLVHLGQPDAAWLALQHARDAADRGSDPLRAASLRGTVSWLLLTQGRYDEAHQLAERSAADIEPVGEVAPPQMSVYGSLLLTGATAAGRGQHAGAAADMLVAAGETASRIGSDRNDYESAFGPSQVIMQTVDVQVVSGQFSDALRTARRMSRDNGLPLAARSRHLADVAYSQAQLGQSETAVDTLLAMEALAPDWIRHQTLPRQTIAHLLRRERPTRLRELAARVGPIPR